MNLLIPEIGIHNVQKDLRKHIQGFKLYYNSVDNSSVDNLPE